MMKRYKNVFSIVVVMLILSGSSAWANLVTNGSFENGVDPGSHKGLTNGSTDITGWEVFGASTNAIDYIGTTWLASDGSRSLDLDGKSPGGVQQTISTIAGFEYLITFDMAGNPAAEPPAVKIMRVSAAGVYQDFYFDVTGHSTTNMGWTSMQMWFTATDTTTTLQFGSMLSGTCGPALDNVSVVAPAPGAILLVGIGTSLVSWLRRRRLL